MKSAALAFFAILALCVPPAAMAQEAGTAPDLEAVDSRARGLERLHGLIIAHDGEEVLARAYRGPALDRTVNIKSVSKSVVSALVGVAIERKVFSGVDQTLGELLGERIPDGADPQVASITIEDLLTMRSGLDRTSGANYGRWISSRNWVDYVLTRPMVDRPGGRMLYSTGSTHVLSALLTHASGETTAALARDWLARPLGVQIPPWQRDRQGIYLGGNNMAMSPRALLAFGELYRNDGMHDGRRVLPEGWVAQSWQPRTASFFTGHGYGYGWFTADLAGHTVRYAWGYGGQMVFVVPDLALTVVMTSSTPTTRDRHVDDLRLLMEEAIIPAVAGVQKADAGASTENH